MGKYAIPGNISFTAERGVVVTGNQISDYLDKTPERAKALEANPVVELPKVIKEIAENQPVYVKDKLLYRIVVISLAAVVLITLIGLILLAAMGKTIPEGMVALGSAAVGGLAGLVAAPKAS